MQGSVLLSDIHFKTITIGILNSYIVRESRCCKDACFPTHISLMHKILQVIVKYVSPGILFPHLCCANLAQLQHNWLATRLCMMSLDSFILGFP